MRSNGGAAPFTFRFPFVKPKIPPLAEVDSEFQRSRDSNYFSNFGPSALYFERRLEAAYFPNSAVIAAANCTIALTGILIALRVRTPVLVPAFTFPATMAAVRSAGLPVVVGDVDAATGVLDAGHAEEMILAHGCRAMIVVRPYGIWSDLSALAAVCARHDVALIVDNAAGLGVTRDVVERYFVPGSFEAFSLHATKPFGVGEGGAVAVPPEARNNVRSALNFGLWALGDLAPGEGVNGKMDELTAAMSIAVLNAFPARLAERQAVAARFNSRAHQSGLETFVSQGEEHTSPWQCFAVRLPEGLDADLVVSRCVNSGLQLRRYYFPLVTGGLCPSELPNAHALSRSTVCLPVYDGPDAESCDEMWWIFSEALAH